MAEKQVIDRGAALAQPTSPSNTPTSKFRFVKNQNPEEPVNLGSKVIQFRRPVRTAEPERGWKESFGLYETSDEGEAGLLRKVAQTNPSLYIFES